MSFSDTEGLFNASWIPFYDNYKFVPTRDSLLSSYPAACPRVSVAYVVSTFDFNVYRLARFEYCVKKKKKNVTVSIFKHRPALRIIPNFLEKYPLSERERENVGRLLFIENPRSITMRLRSARNTKAEFCET